MHARNTWRCILYSSSFSLFFYFVFSRGGMQRRGAVGTCQLLYGICLENFYNYDVNINMRCDKKNLLVLTS